MGTELPSSRSRWLATRFKWNTPPGKRSAHCWSGSELDRYCEPPHTSPVVSLTPPGHSRPRPSGVLPTGREFTKSVMPPPSPVLGLQGSYCPRWCPSRAHTHRRPHSQHSHLAPFEPRAEGSVHQRRLHMSRSTPTASRCDRPRPQPLAACLVAATAALLALAPAAESRALADEGQVGKGER